MPVSHVGLVVSHLPTSCSFFLSALQPLGYRYVGQQGNQILLGVGDDDNDDNVTDFSLCQARSEYVCEEESILKGTFFEISY